MAVTLAWLGAVGELELFLPAPSPPVPPAIDPGLHSVITPSAGLLKRLRRAYRENTKRLRRQLNGSLPTVESGLEIMFASPIYRLNLRDLGVDPAPITRAVADIVLREYYSLVNSSKDKVLRAMEESDKEKRLLEMEEAKRDKVRAGLLEEGAARDGETSSDGGKDEDGDTSLLNDAFFVFQSEQGGWDRMFKGHEVFGRVHGFWARAADHFLRSLGHAPAFEGKDEYDRPQLHAWATVHRECVFHGMHQHGEDIMSGVFYVKMPEKAGRITFYDPRGIHAPFTNRIVVQPQEGDIVLFPSSLVHQVTPTEGDTERISIAVNLLSTDMDARGAEAVPTGMLNPTDSVAVPDIFPDPLYEVP